MCGLRSDSWTTTLHPWPLSSDQDPQDAQRGEKFLGQHLRVKFKYLSTLFLGVKLNLSRQARLEIAVKFQKRSLDKMSPAPSQLTVDAHASTFKLLL